MTFILLLVSIIIFLCIFFNKISFKFGIPTLFIFILLGMFFGSDGVVKIPFENYKFAEQICSVALVFIMFYGGFGTKWNHAKPVLLKSILLSSAGVVLTAGFTALFCFFILKFPLLESMLIGSVISSTDAASVFSLLRSKKLSLKYNTASMLEIESGSNDPFSYMLMCLVLSLMNGNTKTGDIVLMLSSQIIFGILFGVIIGILASFILKYFSFSTDGFDMIFTLAVALLSYSLPAFLGGNGYLSTYISGLIIGNKHIKNKKSLVNFFDGITGLMQILIFFLLGLLSFPSMFPQHLISSAAIALFVTFAARPLTVFILLSPLKCKIRQMLLISWAGLRGAASIVFAIMATVGEAYVNDDLFHIVFCIVLFSISVQGTLLSFIAKKLDMVDKEDNVMKTFNDYAEEKELHFIHLDITKDHLWNGKKIKDISIPPQTLITLIIKNRKAIIPNGKIILEENDIVVLTASAFKENVNIGLKEIVLDENHIWTNKKIMEIHNPDGNLIVLIRRKGKHIIPNGKTKLFKNDTLIICDKF